jgi:hypothetical protein
MVSPFIIVVYCVNIIWQVSKNTQWYVPPTMEWIADQYTNLLMQIKCKIAGEAVVKTQ